VGQFVLVCLNLPLHQVQPEFQTAHVGTGQAGQFPLRGIYTKNENLVARRITMYKNRFFSICVTLCRATRKTLLA
jgi:hypothetical protein